MPSFDLPCSIDQGYNFRKDVNTSVGFLTAIKIGDKALAVDQTCKDPMNPGTDLKVVAVLSSVNWGVGVTDAVYFSGQITAPNRQDVQLLTYLDLTKVEVLFKFRAYDYDPVAKKYYQALHAGDTEMKGILEKQGQDLTLSVSDKPAITPESPITYHFHVGIKPQPTAQTITLATADQKNVVKAWGLTVG